MSLMATWTIFFSYRSWWKGQDATVHCPAAAVRTLEGFLEDNGNVVLTGPGDSWKLGELRITAYRGKHVAFSPSLVLQRFFSPKVFRRPKNLLFLAWAHPRFRERKDTLVYEIEAEGTENPAAGKHGTG